jgi:hypothetical protein
MSQSCLVSFELSIELTEFHSGYIVVFNTTLPDMRSRLNREDQPLPSTIREYTFLPSTYHQGRLIQSAATPMMRDTAYICTC